MFLETFMDGDEGRKISKLARESSTFNSYYKYWRDVLFERVMRLFVWENTGEVQPKEIEQRLILAGHCGIVKYKKELTAMYGSFYGVTKYLDEWTNYNVRCPIYSGSKKIGSDVVVISNNSIRNPVYPLIHHYAIMLAHTEVTLVNCMVNARDAGGVPVVSTEKQKQSVAEYQGKLFNGQYGTVTDVGNLGLQYVGSDRKTAQSIMDVMEVREKLLKSFYSDIGVRSAFEKRNNTIMAEVEADTSLLLLNLSDMIKYREKGADEVNKMFGTNWSVHIAEEINYSVENERVAFDSNTEVHVRENPDDKTKDSE
jgi:hypothetical protein